MPARDATHPDRSEMIPDLELSVFYRLTDRGYRETSLFLPIPPDSTLAPRDDLQNRLNFELTRAIGQHWQVSTAGSFTFNDSDVALYDYNREVIGKARAALGGL